MNELEKPPKELITLSGTIKRELIERTDKNGNVYYFTFLNTEENKEQVIFFFDIPWNLILKVKALQEGDQLTVKGLINNSGAFTVKELPDLNEQS